MHYKFVINGHPISKSNFKPKGGGFSDASKKRSAELAEYERIIGNQVSEQMASNNWGKLCGHIQMMIVLYKKWDRGDVPNYPKSICDALNGILYEDDKQIKILGLYEAGIDAINPRVELLASPIEPMPFVCVGSLAYYLDKDIEKHLMGGKVAKVVPQKKKQICSKCKEVLFEENIGKGWTILTCKNGHHYSRGIHEK